MLITWFAFAITTCDNKADVEKMIHSMLIYCPSVGLLRQNNIIHKNGEFWDHARVSFTWTVFKRLCVTIPRTTKKMQKFIQFCKSCVAK